MLNFNIDKENIKLLVNKICNNAHNFPEKTQKILIVR